MGSPKDIGDGSRLAACRYFSLHVYIIASLHCLLRFETAFTSLSDLDLNWRENK